MATSIIDSFGLTPYFLYVLMVSTLGPLLFGYHLAELNAPQDVITCVRKSITSSKEGGGGLPQCIPMDAAQIGLVSSIFTLGGLIGALAGGPLTSRYGRLKVMRWTTLFFSLGPVAEALAPSIAVMTTGRFISGLGAGASLVTVPLYISETAPPQKKGFFGAFTQIMTNTGILITQVLGYFLSHDQMWRVILAVGGGLGLVMLLGLMFAVDSPKWLVDHGNPQLAKENLKRIRGGRVDFQSEIEAWGTQDAALVDEERETLLASQAPAHGSGGNKNGGRETIGIFSVLSHPEHGRAVLAVVIAMLAQQWCGINSIVMYGVSLLAGLLKSNSALLNVFVSLLNMVVTFACAPLPDILGRKICILTSIVGMGLSSVLLAIGIQNSISLLSAVAVLLFVAAFGFGLGPVPFILSSELVPPEAVGVTQSWALAANWIATFTVAQFFPMVNAKLGGGKVYYLFAFMALVFLFLIAWLVPETKGKKNADEVWGREPRRAD